MLTTENTRHPLTRHGTTQRERLLKALMPENLQLDDRSVADVLAFAGEYAKQIRYWSSDNNRPDGDWACFWTKDATTLLAIVASTDTDDLRVQYRNTELEFLQAVKKEENDDKPGHKASQEKLYKLIALIYETATIIQKICTQIPDKHPIKAEVQSLISSKLGIGKDAKGKKNYDTPLGQLIRYHKGSVEEELLEAYMPFIGESSCQKAWHLTQHDFLNCLDFRANINADDRADLWRLFLAFFKVLTLIVSKAEKAFNAALHGRRDHPPHIALFLSFILLFRRYHQADMNAMLTKHLIFYYRDVLRLQERREIPDRVHIIFEIAQNIETYRLQKGTLLLGGKDITGIDRLYALADELVINKAKLVEKQCLYFHKDENSQKIIPIALNEADMKLGTKERSEIWHPFSLTTFYKKLIQKRDFLTSLKHPLLKETSNLISRITAKPGIIISSPQLFLAKGGQRTIWVEGINSDIINDFDIEVSTVDKYKKLSSTHTYLEGNISVTDLFVTNIKAVVARDGTILGSIESIVNNKTTYGKIEGTINEKIEVKLQFSSPTSFSHGRASTPKQTITFSFMGITGVAEFKDWNTDPITISCQTNIGNIKDINLENITIDSFFNSTNGLRTQLPPAILNIKIKPSEGFSLFFPSDFSDIEPNQKDNNTPNIYPTIRLSLKEDIDYAKYEAATERTIAIQSENDNLKNIILQLGGTTFPAAAEIPLIGSTVPQTLTLYATAQELSVKDIETETVNITEYTLSEVIISEGSTKQSFNFSQWQEIPKPQMENIVFSDKTPISYSPTTPYRFYKQTIGIDAPAADRSINSFKLQPESISISYKSKRVEFLKEKEDSPHKLYFYDFLGGYVEVKKENYKDVPLVPNRELPKLYEPFKPSQNIKNNRPKADGNLRLAFEHLRPGQTLSLLFHFADGMGNPDHIAPKEVIWSYLRDNALVRIPPQYILLDETLGMRQTGITRFQIPLDINNGNTLMVGKDGRKDLFWLQASVSEDHSKKIYADALPMLIDIYPQAGTAVFENHNNDLAHIEKGLPDSTITQLRYRDTNVSKVKQPFPSFNGRLSEAGDRNAYYRRISERLRHKQRAITVWDYERLTLETFPKVAIAKCLSHTRDTDVERPNYITMGVVPYPARMVGDRKFYPIFNAGDLEAIENYLNRHNSYFVSGWGGGVACCCNHDNTKVLIPEVAKGKLFGETNKPIEAHDCCCCDEGEGRLLVRNAIFEPIRLKVCVKFRQGKEPFYYKKQLNGDLKAFLAPWATDTSTPLLFGASIYTTELLRFLEDLDYIDVVMSLHFKHFPNREAADKHQGAIEFEEGEIIQPFTSRSVLTTYLDVMDEDSPNVLDHEINIIEGDACCTGCDDVITELKSLNVPDVAAAEVVDVVKKETITTGNRQILIKPKEKNN
jgi:hypothetical protein